MADSIAGLLQKMRTTHADPVQYHLVLGNESVLLNTLLGKKISLRFTGEIFCIQCARKTQKSFQQGYCFPCYRRLLECNLCIIHPEKCRYQEGMCDPNDWAHAHCGQKHIVYLANSSGLKVGITRATHIPTRWIDQGATQGLPIFSVENRYQAGLVEVALKKYIADKTNWQAMLKSDNHPEDLLGVRDRILQQAEQDLKDLMVRFPGEIQLLPDAVVTTLNYPVLQFPQKIKALNFDKDPLIEGELQGIKAQYLILDTGVISIRKFGGYFVEFKFTSPFVGEVDDLRSMVGG